MYSISTTYHLLNKRAATTNDELLYEWFLVSGGTYLCSTERQITNLTFTHLHHKQLVKNAKITYAHHKCQTTCL